MNIYKAKQRNIGVMLMFVFVSLLVAALCVPVSANVDNLGLLTPQITDAGTDTGAGTDAVTDNETTADDTTTKAESTQPEGTTLLGDIDNNGTDDSSNILGMVIAIIVAIAIIIVIFMLVPKKKK